jgi:hypothetical protein
MIVVSIQLIHVVPPPPCPNLFLETALNKPNYYYRDLVYLNMTLRNLGGQATGVQLELDLPPSLTYAGCDTYRATGQGQHQTFTIGTIDADSTLRFVIYAKVTTDVKVVKSTPILLNHKCTAKGTMHLKITIQANGREKTSTMYVWVK